MIQACFSVRFHTNNFKSKVTFKRLKNQERSLLTFPFIRTLIHLTGIPPLSCLFIVMTLTHYSPHHDKSRNAAFDGFGVSLTPTPVEIVNINSTAFQKNYNKVGVLLLQIVVDSIVLTVVPSMLGTLTGSIKVLLENPLGLCQCIVLQNSDFGLRVWLNSWLGSSLRFPANGY